MSHEMMPDETMPHEALSASGGADAAAAAQAASLTAGPAAAGEASRAAAAGQLTRAERFEQQRAFLLAIDKLKNVQRVSRLTDGSRAENSAEHSWHVAMMALVLHEHASAPVDMLHVLQLLLVHDIVEIDAGDTYCYDEAGYSDKEQRERNAAIRLFGMLPDDQSSQLLALWEEFEAMRTPAAALANALDRLQPFLLGRHRDDGDWKFRARTREQILGRMEPVRTAAPSIWPYVESVIEEAFTTGRFGAPYPWEADAAPDTARADDVAG